MKWISRLAICNHQLNDMIQAKQLCIVQATNIGVIEGVKEKELNFYTVLYMQIGALAVTISGLMFTSLQQVTTSGFIPYEEDEDDGHMEDTLYLLTVSIGGVVGMRVTLVTIYAYVFGNSLAIRGPTGSVSRAVNGLYTELDTVTMALSLMMFFYAISTIFTTFVVMTIECAIINSVILAIGISCTYRSCLRIYNRSKVPEKELDDWDTMGNHKKMSDQWNPNDTNLRTPLIQHEKVEDISPSGDAWFSWLFPPNRTNNNEKIISRVHSSSAGGAAGARFVYRSNDDNDDDNKTVIIS